MRIRILLADDHQIVLQGLQALLEAESDMEVVGGVSDGLAVAEACEKLNPDILVLDLMMPGLNGLDVARLVHQRSPQVRIIVLSTHANEGYVLQALRNGASGYALKESSTETLVDAIRVVISGKRYLCPPLSELAIEAYMQRIQDFLPDPYDTLTGREREVLQLVAEGYNNAAIGERLSISSRTVEVHRARVMEKLRLRNQTDLIKYANQRGILPLNG